MIYSYKEIRHLHLEISSLCNAECPLCPRNLHGYPFNNGYTERNLTLDEVKTIFRPEFLSQLNRYEINGNFGDIVMNPEAVDIIAYFRQHNKEALITVSTNGSARDQNFWAGLAELDCRVSFCIDGLEDTHSLYRKNTRYDIVLKNAQTFIAAGGQAVWSMLEFDHNRHQIEQARAISTGLGFVEFRLIEQQSNPRINSPVFDRNGNLLHVIGQPETIDFQLIYARRTDPKPRTIDLRCVTNEPAYPISCEVKTLKSVYVTSEGEVYPCCYIGFSPKTFGRNTFHEIINYQTKNIMRNNNALEYSLEECIKWFDQVESSWQQPNFESGRLLMCNHTCGVKS
jgi:MoaA/NifB/PqqE/SkfB family radical SAM enzyme